MTHRRKVLFLCTGNSARSQMAEAIVHTRLSRSWEAYSAGTRPASAVNPYALQVLAEIGIEHRGRAKSVDEFRQAPFDLVVTVCDSAAGECPAWLGEGRRVHLAFPDPSKAKGSEGAVLEVFRQVRDDIARKIPELLNTYDLP